MPYRDDTEIVYNFVRFAKYLEIIFSLGTFLLKTSLFIFDSIIWIFAHLFVPFLYKTEINYLARVTKIMGIVNKNTRDYATSRYLTCVSK